MKKLLSICAVVLFCLGSSSCGNSSRESSKIAELEAKISALESELVKETENYKETSQAKEKEEEQTTVAEEKAEEQAVEVLLSGKSVAYKNLDLNRYSDWVLFEFTVTNKTNKEIKGVSGVAQFNDMFDKNILSLNCDFTDVISPNSSIIVDDLYIEINQFMDEHNKLLSTEYDGIIFDYKVNKIVYTDGTTESFN